MNQDYFSTFNDNCKDKKKKLYPCQRYCYVAGATGPIGPQGLPGET